MDPAYFNSNVQYQYENWKNFFQLLMESSVGLQHQALITNSCVTTNEWTSLTRRKADALRFQMPHELQTGDGVIAAVTSTPNIDVTNAALVYQKIQNELELIKNLKSNISSVKTFMFKVKSALSGENKLREQLSKTLSTLSEMEFIEDDVIDDIRLQKLPKLGKVYAELSTVINSCQEVTVVLFQSSAQLIHKLQHLRKQCNTLRGQMLLHVKWLILTRLENIGLMAYIYGKGRIDLPDVLFNKESKKFCKLIATYNKSCVEHVKCSEMKENVKNAHVKHLVSDVSGHPLPGEFKGFERNSLMETGILPVSGLSAITIDIILLQLSKYSSKDIGFHAYKILQSSVFQHTRTTPQGPAAADAMEQGYAWNLASKIEIRPMQSRNSGLSFHRVIKRVADTPVPASILENSKKDCSAIMNLFDCQEATVSSFLAELGGKTKILRNFGDNGIPDDAMSVASASSRASSSLAHSVEFKSVSWKDSSNNEAMRMITSKHLDYLADSISELCLCHDHGGYNDSSKLSCLSAYRDIDLIVMQAVIANLGCLEKLSNQVHESLNATAKSVIVNAALSCSDRIVCEMLGKMTPHFDKPSLQMSLGKEQVCLTTSLFMSALQPLLHIGEYYPSNDKVTRITIPSIQSLLACGYNFIATKIQHVISTKDLRWFLSLVLIDLRMLTSTAIECLKVVEGCHNEIEKRRNHDGATLIFSTRYLHDIDSLITKMQIASTTSMTKVSKITSEKSMKILNAYFPAQKSWMQKSSIDSEVKNRYIQEMISDIATDVCAVVSSMEEQFQLAGIVPVVSATFEAILKHIASLRYKFSVQGGLQLEYDLIVLRDSLISENSTLYENTKRVIPSLHPVRRAFEVAELLCSTDLGRFGDRNLSYQNQRPASRSYSWSQTESVLDLDNEFWLSLRRGGRESKKWSSFLPCLE